MAIDPIDEAVALVEIAAKRDPRTAMCGILIADRSLGVGDQHSLLWFETPAEIADFVVHPFRLLYCSEDEDESVRDELTEIAEAIREHGLSEDALDKIGSFTLQWIKLVWCGTLEELCSGEGDASLKLIAWFRGEEDGGKSLPIEPEEVDGFVEFLTELHCE